MAPTFFFRIDKMRPSGRYRQRADRNGVWLPPRAYGANVIDTGDTTGLYFYFDGTRAYQVTGIPEGITPWRTTSVYYDNEIGFWAVPYDATRFAVGNGRQTEDDEDEDEEDEDAEHEEEEGTQHWVDWNLMRFIWDETAYRSQVHVGGQYNHLQCQRPDQRRWVNQIFPQRYRAPQDRVTDDRRFGGLNGDLSLLLALVAFSVRARDVHEAVRTCLTGDGWQPHDHTSGHGWRDRRGVVVSIWYDPNYHNLQAYENGDAGNIYN